MKPFVAQVSLTDGSIAPCHRRVQRRLSDVRDIFGDRAEAERMLAEGDPLVYEVFEIVVPEENGQIIHGTSIIYPGKVGNEYFMTRGHYHEKDEAAEVYFCLQGRGCLLLETKDGETDCKEIAPGISAYAPPGWAHRTINTGDEPFICFYAVDADAGHDYGAVAEGFHLRIMSDGKDFASN